MTTTCARCGYDQTRHDAPVEHGTGTALCPGFTASTYAPDSIASFAARIEQVASPQTALWYEQ